MAMKAFIRFILNSLREALLWVPYLEVVLCKLYGSAYTRWLRPDEYWAELRDYDKQLFFQQRLRATWLDQLLS